MNAKYSRRKATPRRESGPKSGKYRTLLRSYLYDPPVWVYIVELVVAAVMILVLIYGGDYRIFDAANHFWNQK